MALSQGEDGGVQDTRAGPVRDPDDFDRSLDQSHGILPRFGLCWIGVDPHPVVHVVHSTESLNVGRLQAIAGTDCRAMVEHVGPRGNVTMKSPCACPGPACYSVKALHGLLSLGIAHPGCKESRTKACNSYNSLTGKKKLPGIPSRVAMAKPSLT